MAVMILGLILFLGIHSVRLVSDSARDHWMNRLGEGPWKGLYTVISLVGFVLIIWGYGLARQNMVWLWVPPVALAHIAALLMLFSFIFLVAAFVPGTHIKARLGHPMVLGVKVWALAHVLSNGTLADVILFGSFLVWSVAIYAKARRRDRANGVTYKAISAQRDAIAVVIGLVAWGVFALFLHGWLIGVKPFG
ncbi:NnrU family protein [Salinispirillum marinum]|uniref:NnrU family protein n=2 Tax=Saccharospirillaceae TaxID=255527 RepID=A0ABV8BEM5_9GAMM